MLKKKHLFFLCFLLLCTASLLCAFGRKEKTDGIPMPNIVLAEGLIRLVGNANFPELIISGTEHVWVITSDERDKLINMQYRTVKVEGEETVTELKFNNGRPAGLRRELKNIKIIEIKE